MTDSEGVGRRQSKAFLQTHRTGKISGEKYMCASLSGLSNELYAGQLEKIAVRDENKKPSFSGDGFLVDM